MKKLILVSLVLSIFACQQVTTVSTELETEYINPASGYSQVVSVTANGIKTLYISGQIGEGEDLESQMRSALANLKEQLAAGGATYEDIVKMNTYIVDYKPEDLAVFRDTRKDIMGDADMPASTLVGVTALALPEWIIEIEAVAVLKVQ